MNTAIAVGFIDSVEITIDNLVSLDKRILVLVEPILSILGDFFDGLQVDRNEILVFNDVCEEIMAQTLFGVESVLGLPLEHFLHQVKSNLILIQSGKVEVDFALLVLIEDFLETLSFKRTFADEENVENYSC